MTRDEARNMLVAKMICLTRETSGTDVECNSHNCENCGLNYDQGNMGEQIEALDMAIKSLEAEPCEDCISREAVIQIIENKLNPCTDMFKCLEMSEIKEDVEHLPSVTPTRPKSKWIEVSICNCHATLKCSVCDRVIEPTFTFGEYSYEDIIKFYPYCHCGADMRGDEK